MKSTSLLVVAFLSLGLLAGCGASPDKGAEYGADGGPGGPGGGGFGMGRPGGSGSDLYGDMKGEPAHRVQFDLNSAILSDEGRRTLIHNAKWIKENNFAEVMVEGHCDERGTREYNLALGQKRADAAMQVLVEHGVSAQTIRTVSYGKERPLVQGHDDYAWSQNRRAEILFR